jgi:hypothetical protein
VKLEEFVRTIFTFAERSSLCEIVTIIALDETTVRLRVLLYVDAFIDVYYNERNGTTAYAMIQNNARIFGADNANGWHYHPFDNPSSHARLSQPMSFAEFLAMIEQKF